MTGGIVDLDGVDAHGGLINIDAPVVINAQTMSSFGRMNVTGVNTLDINHNVGTGSLTVNLDENFGSWTLNEEGVMNLVNDNTAAVLLAGDDVNLNGTVNVTGNVQLGAKSTLGQTRRSISTRRGSRCGLWPAQHHQRWHDYRGRVCWPPARDSSSAASARSTPTSCSWASRACAPKAEC